MCSEGNDQIRKWVATSKVFQFLTKHHAEKHYFNAPKVIHLLLEHGAKQGKHRDEDDIRRPRHGDEEFAEIFQPGDKWIVEQQPYYEMWKVLYDMEDGLGCS